MFYVSSFSCINEYGHTADGEKRDRAYSFLRPSHLKFHKIIINDRIDEIIEKIKIEPGNFKHWSDLAINYMKRGNTDSALAILKPIAIQHPNEYTVIANLGTAYELKNELDSALKYISHGFKLNPNSHRKSEWIHIAILKAKIKQRSAGRYLEVNPIISEKLFLRHASNTSNKHSFQDTQNQILYQIKTRAPFTPAPNQVITNLFLNLARLNLKHGTLEGAFAALVQADYFNNNDRIKGQINTQFNEVTNTRQKSRHRINSNFERELKLLKIVEPHKYLALWKRHRISEVDTQDTAVQKSTEITPLESPLPQTELIPENTPINLPELPNDQETTEDSNWSLYLIGLTLVLLFFMRRYKKSIDSKN